MQIPNWPSSTSRELELISEVLRSTAWGGSHPFIAQFERKFADFHGCRHAVTVANGSLALELILWAAGIGPGDEVIVPAHSFIASASAVCRYGAIPVFADVDPDSFNLDPAATGAAVSPKTRAIMPVHFGGMTADMDALDDIARRHGLLVVEDAAQAQGSEWRGRRPGQFGLAAAFSFQSSKVMTAGEGGLVLTNDDAFAARARSLANHGRREGHGWFDHFDAASNFRLSGIQAAVLLAQLERLPDQIAQRTRAAGRLRQATAAVEGLRWQDVPAAATAHNYYLLLGRHPRRDDLRTWLDSKGIPSTPYYPRPLYANPAFETTPHRVTPCPNAEQLVRDAFWLPLRLLMADDSTLDEVAAAFRDFRA
ncbi:MAG: DegT/DnrJ/EryC1/StrS family aminotransferase [Bryobacteraceae bacterium]